MPSRRPPSSRRAAHGLEARLAAVHALAADPAAPASRAGLRVALGDTHGVVVAAAANVIAEAEVDGLGAELAAAFNRFLERPVETDPGCLAKSAIVRALLATGAPDVAVCRPGVRHVQEEPVWGGTVDTAAELRAQSALGLVRARAS